MVLQCYNLINFNREKKPYKIQTTSVEINKKKPYKIQTTLIEISIKKYLVKFKQHQ